MTVFPSEASLAASSSAMGACPAASSASLGVEVLLLLRKSARPPPASGIGVESGDEPGGSFHERSGIGGGMRSCLGGGATEEGSAPVATTSAAALASATAASDPARSGHTCRLSPPTLTRMPLAASTAHLYDGAPLAVKA